MNFFTFDTTVGVIIFLSTVIISRIIGEKAMKQLNNEEKVSLLEAFSGYRMYSLIPIILLAGGYWVVIKMWPELSSAATLLYLLCLVIFVIAVNVLTYQQLKSLHLPSSYITQYQISRIIQYVGIGILFAIVALNVTHV